MNNALLYHATCVAIGGRGVLLGGPSGAGKSDLALRLIDRGAVLVADDYVELAAGAGRLVARAPERLRGLLEVRGLGIYRFNIMEESDIYLMVNLDSLCKKERLPPRENITLCGVGLPQVHLSSYEASAPVKVEWALRALEDGSLQTGFLRE